ncbi:ArnT family glycosyltransferase [Mycobacterium sp. NPDC004974]
MTATALTPDQLDSQRAPFATAGVAAIAAAGSIALLVFLGRYGYFGDELYFVSAGRRLAAGYADQGPLLPLIAHLMNTLAPGSLFALRLPAVIATAAAIVLSALIARELGGERGAQLLAAAGYATSPFLLVQGGQLSTNAIDIPLWVLITWLLVRWVRTRHDTLLVWAAVATAIDLQIKWLIPFLWICVGIGALLAGPRDLLTRKALWISAAGVLATVVPMLVWQARNGWPQLEMGAVIAAENSFVGGRLTFLPLALFIAGIWGGVLLLCGTWALLCTDRLREYRFLGVATVMVFAVFIALGGRPYYVAGLYGLVMAAGAVWLTRRPLGRWMRAAVAMAIALSTALAGWALPWESERDIAPASADDALAVLFYGKFGWPELAQATVAAYRTLTPQERINAVVIAESYWQASALDIYGKDDLPAVFSPSRGWWYFGTPPDSATTVLYVDQKHDTVRGLCTDVQPLDTVDARLGYPGITRDVTIWKCTGPREAWSQAWPSLRRL